MKLDLKVRNYVRTKEGYIAKLLNYGYNSGINGKSYLFDSQIRDITDLVYEQDDFLWDSELKKYIYNFSDKLIDLVEVGDYVNGYKVVDIKIFSDGNKYVVIATEEHQSFWKDKVFEDEIKSIVTKEQFEQMSYKVGE